jgi:hypothetical protein
VILFHGLRLCYSLLSPTLRYSVPEAVHAWLNLCEVFLVLVESLLRQIRSLIAVAGEPRFFTIDVGNLGSVQVTCLCVAGCVRRMRRLCSSYQLSV